jgi:hypothetical protein
MNAMKEHEIEQLPLFEGKGELATAEVKAPEKAKERLLVPRVKFVGDQMVPDFDHKDKASFLRYLQARAQATGTKDDTLSTHFIMKAIYGCGLMEDAQSIRSINAIMANMAEMGPLDASEGMLITQMIAVYNQVMKCMEYAAKAQTMEITEKYINMATKLQRTFTAQMEALNRHRRKGAQKVVVQHVNVNDGGQAIVGSIEGGGGKIYG